MMKMVLVVIIETLGAEFPLIMFWTKQLEKPSIGTMALLCTDINVTN